MDEFSELSKEKAELIANRIYDLDGKFDTQISDDTSNQHHTQIGYKIGGSFEDYSDNGDIGFEILFVYLVIMSVIAAITHGRPETLGCIVDKLVIIVSGIGSIALIIFLIGQIG